jgi:hypothetical protein
MTANVANNEGMDMTALSNTGAISSRDRSRRRASRLVTAVVALVSLTVGSVVWAESAGAAYSPVTGATVTTTGRCGFHEFFMNSSQNTGFDYRSYQLYNYYTKTWNNYVGPWEDLNVYTAGRYRERGYFAVYVWYADYLGTDSLGNHRFSYAGEFLRFSNNSNSSECIAN